MTSSPATEENKTELYLHVQTLKDKHDKFIVFHPFIDYTKYLLGDSCVLGSALGWDAVL